ncbi:MAG: hypothetical protein ACE5IB_04365, partial [Candidatus Geothermarchaeales archaeon]
MKLDLDEVLNIEETVVSVSGARHRTTVPSTVFKKLKLREEDKLRWILKKDGTVVIMKVETEPRSH